MQIAKPKRPPLIVANTIIPREIDWLWYPYIPAGAASLLFGPGGQGKSHITVDIAARLSTGTALPGQAEAGVPQKVLMLSAEDDFDAVLVPRLMRARADLSRIAFPKTPFTLDQRGLSMLDDYMHEFAATVVFIDPIVSYIGSKVDINKANQTREFTGGLHDLAMKRKAAVLIVGHSRKGSPDDQTADWERAMGSADFSNAVRSVMYVTRANDGTRVMRHVKANYAALGPSMGFEFGDGGFKWLGEINEDGEMQPVQPRPRGKAEAWLRARLSGGPVPSRQVEDDARAAGLSKRTLDRAKQTVAESFMAHVDGKPVWYWILRADTPAVGDEPEDERWIEEDEIPVQSVEKPRRRGRSVPSASGGRRRDGRNVDPGAGATAGAAVRPVGRGGYRSAEEALLERRREAAAKDPKALAREFLRGLHAGAEDTE